MLTRLGRRPLNLARRAAEARRRTGLHDAFDFDKRTALNVMRMARRLRHAQYGREANVAALHDLAPFFARLGLEQRREFFLQIGPRLAIHPARHLLSLESRPLEQLGVKLRLD